MDDALAVFVVFIYIKVDRVSHVYEFFVSLEIPAGFAHDNFIAVIDKVESAYSFDNSTCHISLAVVIFITALAVLTG